MNRIMSNRGGLCRPLDPYTRYDVVHARTFPEYGFAIYMRPLYLGSDAPLLYKWVNKEYIRPTGKRTIPYDEIIKTLIHTAHSDFGQVFTCMDEAGHPLCEVQVVRATQDDELGLKSVERPGDYVLHLMPCLAAQEQNRAIIQTCVEYFLLHPEVKRILTLADEENVRDNTTIRKAGFSLLTKILTPYKTDNLYEYLPIQPSHS